jgi:hypothetical protein
VCFLVTVYWPFDENGQAVAWNYQADGNPNHTADGFRITPADQFGVAAVPLPILQWGNRNGGGSVVLWDGIAVPMHDTFGNQARQDGIIWHEVHQQKLIGIDVLADPDIHPINWIFCDGTFITN